jgi:restriction endonuclease Mrr
MFRWFRSWRETRHLLHSPANAERLFGAVARLDRGLTPEILEVEEFQALLGALKDSKMTIEVDFSQVVDAIAEVEALKAACQSGESDEPIKVYVDTTGVAAAEAELEQLECEHYLYLDGKELRTFMGDS